MSTPTRNVRVYAPLVGWPGIVVFLVFLLLKVFGVVDWSWWLVTLPLYLFPALFLAIAFVVGALFVLAASVLHLWEKWDRRKTRKQREERQRAMDQKGPSIRHIVR